MQCGNWTEFSLTALDHRAYWTQVQLDFSRPGRPVDNCECEAFDGRLRREGLSQHWFDALAEAQVIRETWRQDYNNYRPHTTLGLRPPAVYPRAGIYEPRTVRVLS